VPAAKSEAPPPPAPRVSERTPDDPTYDDHQAEQGDVADAWARAHSGVVSIAEAYRAGYLDGVRAARAVVEPPPGGTGTGGTDTLLLSTRKVWRTVIVALELFREQVLVAQPEEVATGEWLSPAGVNEVIGELQQLLANSEEPAHV
jgi:hypothetical protein